jgi:hypothetical protein
MLEIFAIFFLARSNGKKAIDHGLNPTVYNLLTIIFWIGFEFLGAFLTALLTGGEAVILVYIFALIFAVIGGFIPRLIVVMKNKTPIKIAMQKALESSKALNTPAQITLSNLMSDNKTYHYFFYHNGKPLGIIQSNNQIVLTTDQSVNIIAFSYRDVESAPFILTLNDGETAEVVFDKGKLQRRA